MQKLLNIAKVIDAINEWIGRFAYWIILLMIFIGVWNVVGRYVGRFLGYTLTSNALIEIQWYLFDIVFFLGAAYTLKHNGHVRVDVFYKDLSLKQKALVDFIGTFIFLIPFCLVIIYYSWDNVINSWKFLNINGYLICDDYIWAFYPQIKDNPCYFINKFLNQIKGNFKIKKISNSQIFIKKIN